MGRIIEVLIALNAVGGICALGSRYFTRRRRESNIDHVRQLEQENKEIDETLKRMRGEPK